MLGPSDHFFFFFNDTATTEIYTLSLHDALPIWSGPLGMSRIPVASTTSALGCPRAKRSYHARTSGVTNPSSVARQGTMAGHRSEEHTSELQSLAYLVCRLLLEKKKTQLPPTRAR